MTYATVNCFLLLDFFPLFYILTCFSMFTFSPQSSITSTSSSFSTPSFLQCWGCMVWVPSVYTSHALFLTTHPNQLGFPLAVTMIVVGLISIFLNYDADRQRELARNTDGACTIWGQIPELIRATYHTSEGRERQSLLLVSGWWGVARHFHYVPELLAALFWTLPALFTSAVPYFYFFFLLILLTHRASRDDKRCAEKYGKYWKHYCQRVPYKILPFVF